MGFERYSAGHLIILAIIVLACIMGAFFFRRLPEKGKRGVSLFLGIVITAMDLIHYWLYWRAGILGVMSIPLHLCALAVYVVLIHSIWKPDWAGQVLYALSLPGVWCALIFPDWTAHDLLSYPSLHSFIMHGLISLYIIMQVTGKRIVPRLSAIWKCLVFLCVTAPVAAAANHVLGTNFMFLSDPVPGSPLQFLYELANGNGILYLVYLAILALILMTLMYVPFEIYRKVRGR